MNQLKKSLEQHVMNDAAMYDRVRSTTLQHTPERRNPMPKKLIWSVGVAAALVVAIIASVTLLTPPVLTQTADSKPATTAQVADVETTAYAMVSIDINPSFELYLDESGSVLKIKARTDDAEALKEANEDTFKAWLGQPVADVTSGIIAFVASKGFIDGNASDPGYAVVSTVVLNQNDPDAEANQEAIGQKIKAALEVEGALDDSTKVEIIKATLREKMQADKEFMPLGLYIIKGLYVGPENFTDDMIKVKKFVKSPDSLAKLLERAEEVTARREDKAEEKATKQSEKEIRQSEREANRVADGEDADVLSGTPDDTEEDADAGKPENPGSQGKGRQ